MGILLYNKGDTRTKRGLTSIGSLLLFLYPAFGKEVCYKVEYFFIDVAQVCISYEKDKEKISSKVKAETTGIIKLFRNIKYRGFSITREDFKPEKFYFFQKEKKLNIIHSYEFKDNKVLYQKKVNNKTLKKVIPLKEKILEPFSAGLYLFEKVKKQKEGSGILKIFFNGEIQNIKYKIKENKIIIKPDIKIEGIIKPTGNWEIKFNEGEKYPEEMVIRIRIGKVRLKREE